jgi:hypothetical protein
VRENPVQWQDLGRESVSFGRVRKSIKILVGDFFDALDALLGCKKLDNLLHNSGILVYEHESLPKELSRAGAERVLD